MVKKITIKECDNGLILSINGNMEVDSLYDLCLSIFINNTFISNCFILSLLVQSLMISPFVYKMFGLSYNNYLTYLTDGI